jgi:uncharacterized protein (DUF488 family)
MPRCHGVDDRAGRPAGEQMTLSIYTLGHSSHPPDVLVDILRQHGIQQVVDVRSSPYSRYVPQANREALSRSLEQAGIAYRWMGDELGGKPQGVVADYDQLRAAPAFRHGIVSLVAQATQRRTAILCAEGDFRLCHRYKLITPALREQHVRVLHIEPDGTLVDDDSAPRQLSLF